MRKFQVFRYLKKLRYLIVVITLIGSLVIYWYAQSNQTYSAEVVIQYTNPTAKYGTAPDGSKINPKDVYSAAVITDVKKDLNIKANIDQIRSACQVEEVISEDDEKRKDALLDKGEEFNEVCTTYRIKYQADNTASKDYVRNVLDSIINNYYVFYSQKYIDSATIPNNSLNISAEKYDYINCIEILEKSIDEIDEYLKSKSANYSGFRSSRTGYTFDDLRNSYQYIKDNNISQYYAIVIGDKLTTNKEELICAYNNRLDRDIIDIDNLSDHITEERTLIDQFASKITQHDSTVAGAIGDNTDAIIEDVEEYWSQYLDVDTTYDDLINTYVSHQSDRNSAEIDRDYCKEILSVFDSPDVKNSVNTPQTEQLLKDLNETIVQMNELYKILEETAEEQSEYTAAKNINALSGIYAEESINVKLYVLLAAVLFFVVGCIGAIVIGRLIDIWEYIVYVDKKTGLANRSKCDIVIDEYAKKVLADNFTCIVFKIHNLGFMNIKSGHNAGDSLLKRFGKFLNDNFRDYGFVGYNDGNMFIVLLENCTKVKAEGHIKNLHTKMENGEEMQFDFDYGVAESTSDNMYEIRELIKKAIERLAG